MPRLPFKTAFTVLLIALHCFADLSTSAQATYNWAVRQKSGGTMHESPDAMCVGTDGNVYVALNFNSSDIEFKTGLSVYNTGTGYYDVVIVKYDAADGAVLWIKPLRGIYHEQARSMACGSNGNIYIGGTFRSPYMTVGIDTIWNREYGNIYPQEDMFMIALSEDSGNVQWTKGFGGTGSDYLTSLASDHWGNIIAGGYYYSDSLTLGTTQMPADPYGNMFILKMNGQTGNILWARTHNSGGQYHETLKAISIDNQGNIYTAGEFNSSWLVFDSILLIRQKLIDVYLIRFNAQGVATWGMVHSGPNNDYVQSIATYHNKLYLCIDNTIIYENGIWPDSSKLMKIDIAGKTIEWNKNFSRIRFKQVVIDTSGYVLTGGYARDTTNMDGVLIKCYKEYWPDLFVLALDTASGKALWAKTYTKLIESGFVISRSSLQSMCTNHNGTVFTGFKFNNIGIQLDNIMLTNAFKETYDYIISRINYPYIGVGVEETPQDNGQVWLYPNPGSNELVINSTDIIEQCTVRDMSGAVLLHISGQSLKHTVNTTSMASGIYIVSMQIQGMPVNRLWVKAE
ncbi:MAG: T9SS type A sorting domain-containing protein [Bacteroidota bacterium]